MRAIWSGSITFGLVTIPVKLYTAVGRRKSIDLHMLHDKDGERIHYKRFCEQGHEVEWDDIVKGYEYEKGKWVTFSDEELEALDTQSVRTVDVVEFVPQDQIDPIYFEKTYYIAPEEGGLKAYRLMLDALESEEVVGVSKVAIRQRESLAAIRIIEGQMVLHTMRWPDEIRESDFEVLEKRADMRSQEKEMARQLVRQLTGDFDPDQFEDDYHNALKELVDKKVAGEDIVVHEEEEPTQGVVDLMEALKRSVDAARSGREAKPARAKKGKSAFPTEDDLADCSKDELYERAKELDIPGRSSMDKKELIAAIAGAARSAA